MATPDFVLNPSRLGVIIQRQQDHDASKAESSSSSPATGSSGVVPTSPLPSEPESTTEQPPASEEVSPED